MANKTTIITKYGTTTPSAGVLAVGELAVDHTNKKIFTKNAAGAVITLAGLDTLPEILANGNTTGANDIAVDTNQKVQFRDTAIYINSSADGQLDIVADTEIQIAATTVDLNGNLDVSGTLGVTGVLTANAGIDVTGTAEAHKVEIGDGSAGGTSEILFSDNVSARGKILYDHSSSPETMVLQTTGTTAISIDNSQNVSMPNGNLDVTGSVTADGLTVEQNVGSKLTLSSTDTTIQTGNVIGEIDFYSADRSGIGAASRATITALSADATGGGEVYIKTSTGGLVVANRLKVAKRGDISFYEDTGTTPKFFWDASSESLGIGTSSPLEKLYVNSTSGDARIGLNAPTGSDTEIKFFNNGIVDYTIGHDDATDNFVIGTTNVDTPLISVNKAGNVGIGCTPKTILNASTSTGAILTLENSGSLTTNDVIGGVDFYANDGSNNGTGAKVNIRAIATSAAGTVTALTFGTSDSTSATASERLRIDSSGHAIIPAGVTLGTATGVYAAANTLDDYEEGTWTPTNGNFSTWTSPTFIATYTKVGRQVTVNLEQTGGTIAASSAGRSIQGLPFTSAAKAVGSVSDATVNSYGNVRVTGTVLYFTSIIAAESDLIVTLTYYV